MSAHSRGGTGKGSGGGGMGWSTPETLSPRSYSPAKPTYPSSSATSSRFNSRAGSPIATTNMAATNAGPNHPLHLPPTPKSAQFPFASTSTATLGSTMTSSTSTSSFRLTPSSDAATAASSSTVLGEGGSGQSTVRIRRGHSPNPSVNSSGVFATTSIDADVTRPSLRRLTNETSSRVASPSTTAGVAAWSGNGGPGSGTDSTRASLDNLSRPSSSSRNPAAEREVVVHKLVKTDTLASICLKYGISAQALRSSNRLWPSDPIHLRATLNIPLDQCHLSSASAGIERIVREEDGNLVVWERDRPASTSTSTPTSELPSASASTLTSPWSTSNTIASSRNDIVSPRVRRVTSNLHEVNDSASSSTADLLNIWNNPEPPHSLLDDLDEDDAKTISLHPHSNDTVNGFGKGKGRAIDASPADYLSLTNNPFASPTFQNKLISITPDPPIARSRSSTMSSSTSSVNPFAVASPPTGSNGTAPDGLSKRTLTIERLPSSALSFFPPSANHSSPDRKEYLSSPFSSPQASHSIPSFDPWSNGHRTPALSKRKSSIFGPLVNTLARLTTLESGEEYARRSSASSTPAVAMTGAKNASSSSSSSSSSAGKQKAQRKGWDLTYFGQEEYASK
ncbi:BZ3500_MvSof-1268-A1-R1_Chr9g10484 [Microbotryum saponariae]|uniref:BZ3500_MvSof-1268-A1-R1_Chr9g10484 protein n=1 Tax=Microbotryum saponariae TaxID=289078 RepID=A0A2X0K912_9BASI|nr:BZ3501_MvSof-1269-A2-R1_Chr9g10233 [Microbotryum saponariae]SDA00170.1 BZ3500_MvSof-1268-A1-R1_Chr9g10484 [Microbotryum saponariae]